jgi:hypothetical protein
MTPALVFLLFAVDVPPPETPARAVADRAGLFSPAAIADARRRIDAVRSSHGIELMIETATELPDLSSAELRKLRNRESKARLRKIAQDHADAAGCNGLFVLIVKDPPNVTVVGWPGQRELDISSVKRENLRKYLARELGTYPDRALLGACDTFEEIVRSIQARPPSPFAPLSALALIGSLFGVWIVFGVVRSRVVCPALPIYQPAMLGSLFGVPSAYWIYDRLFHAEHPLVLAPAPTPPATEPPAEPAPKDIGDLL